MSELILRIRDGEDEIEVLSVVDGKELFSSVSGNEVKDVMIKHFANKDVISTKPKMFLDPSIIAYSDGCVLINQPGTRKVITTSIALNDAKAYSINFPNAIYLIGILGSEISTVKAFCYKEFKGIDTALFAYGMPNMLSGNSICLGSAPRGIHNRKYTEALEKIIFAPFTHSTVNNVKSFNSTNSWFSYLENNEFPYELLMDVNTTMGDLVEVIK